MSLLLHAGTDPVDREIIAAMPPPKSLSAGHSPIHHRDFISMVDEGLQSWGFRMKEEAYGLTNDGNRFFGLATIESESSLARFDYEPVLGLRGSHDQSMSRGLAYGAHVLVCDNLSFWGDVTFKTKHTSRLLDRLPKLIEEFCSGLINMVEYQENAFEAYKSKTLSSRAADAAITGLIRNKIILPTEANRVIKEWDEPSYPEFTEDGLSVWRLFNAATEAYKRPLSGQPALAVLPERTKQLHRFCDELADFKVAA